MDNNNFVVLKQYNDRTQLIYMDDKLQVLKQITPLEIPVYTQIKDIPCDGIARITHLLVMDGRHYAVQEYIEGPTLEEYLCQHETTSRQMVVDVVTALCDALEPLHARGIIHRDISPKNIVLSRDGAKLIDFGISRIAKDGKGRDTEILGTQGYAAPEQFGFSQTSPRADIYSLGVLINVMLTGAMPNQRLCDGEFRPVVNKCTQMDQTHRYETVTQLKKTVSGKGFWYWMSRMPGFRTNRLYKKLIALAYFFFCLGFSAFAIAAARDTKDTIGSILFCIFSLYLPPFILLDFGQWSHRLSFMHNTDNAARIILRVVLTAIAVLVGLMSFALLAPTPA